MRFTWVACALVLLVSCQHAVLEPLPALQFTGAPYRLNIAHIKVVEEYKSPRRLPNVEHLADVTPAAAVGQWAQVRLLPAGNAGRLEVVIQDASVVKKELPKQKKGLAGAFTKEQTEEYQGVLAVQLKLYNERRILPVAHVEVTAHLSHTLREDATLLDRERLYHQMTVELMQEVERQLDNNIRRYFSGYLL